MVRHGDKVLFLGSQFLYGLKPLTEYTVFGFTPINLPGPDCDKSMPVNREEQISVYVDDPIDDCGGVLTAPASAFELLEVRT